MFDGKWPKIDTLLFHSELRGLVWVGTIQNALRIKESSWWLRSFKSMCNLYKSGVGDKLWSPPRYECVKFNVRGMAIEDEAGGGEVLRDADGMVRILFLVQWQQKMSLQRRLERL